ncbi:unnamed protein product [Haemonchus placei]|uniref:Secreted protein n=1 Tax=Haemonchus placei TaxID=6290 RepID=A0A0N4VXU4_HAEPC|nr:unnamed protein product [Haemonchus placei]
MTSSLVSSAVTLLMGLLAATPSEPEVTITDFVSFEDTCPGCPTTKSFEISFRAASNAEFCCLS